MSGNSNVEILRGNPKKAINFSLPNYWKPTSSNVK